MSKAPGFLQTSVGKKYIMAATGIILFGFVIGHMLGNLQVFSGPEKLNSYAHFLQNLGPALWGVRIFLMATFLLHVFTAFRLVSENKKARPQNYQVFQTRTASFASRTMIYSGLIILAFLIYHILHFTVGMADSSIIPQAELNGKFDVYYMVVKGFSKPVVSIAYIIAMALLCYHLSHGIFSIFQTFGVNHPKYDSLVKSISIGISLIIFIGNSSIPVAVLMKLIQVSATPTGGM